MCPFCEATGHLDGALCPACRETLAPTQGNTCGRCGAPAPRHLALEAGCPRCRKQTFAFAGVYALGDYAGPLRKAVIKMKRPYGELLALSLGEALAGIIPDATVFDAIAPVPMHLTRRLARGVNSPEILAEAIGRSVGARVCIDLLRHRRKIAQQSALAPQERKRNVREAFRVSSSWKIADASILLVDDILTTGATADACTKVLLAAGAAQVRVAVVARGGATS